jgi:hypothetical protein
VETLHVAYRVTDLGASVEFCEALGYAELGRVDIDDGATLIMLKFPCEAVVALELVHRPADGPAEVGTGSAISWFRSTTSRPRSRRSRRPGSPLRRPRAPVARTGPGPRGSPTPTATGSSGPVAARSSLWHHRRRLRLSVQPRSGSAHRRGGACAGRAATTPGVLMIRRSLVRVQASPSRTPCRSDAERGHLERPAPAHGHRAGYEDGPGNGESLWAPNSRSWPTARPVTARRGGGD